MIDLSAAYLDVLLRRCQRCGMDHQMRFTRLDNPADDYGWWGMCPNKNQPVLMKVTKDEDRTAGTGTV